jgi:alanyl-tRNA synthetase
VRVIEVEGFDFTPCGGTHCTRTGQIGPVRIIAIERYKGGTRVSFAAGARALADARAKEAILRELAKGFTCGVAEVPAAVAKLRADLDAKTKAFAAARGELLSLLAERILGEHPRSDQGAPTRVVITREGDDLAGLRALASALAKRSDVIAFVATRDKASGDLLLVVERGTDATPFDAGAWFKRAAGSHGGRGGGRPDRAEGRLSLGPDVDLRVLVES